jgi:hypothetical protein
MSIRSALLTALGSRPTPRQRRALAAELRALADEQERLADADERVGHRLRQAREPQPGATGGRPRGSGGRFVRWEPPTPARSGTLHISAALWHALGDPLRLDAQRYGGRLILRPCAAPDGYAVSVPTGARGGNPRIRLGQEAADTLRLEEGRIEAEVRDGAIVSQ